MPDLQSGRDGCRPPLMNRPAAPEICCAGVARSGRSTKEVGRPLTRSSAVFPDAPSAGLWATSDRTSTLHHLTLMLTGSVPLGTARAGFEIGAVRAIPVGAPS